ncbi:hypothetical protein AAIO99_11645, partial [Streptomyces sp. AC154]
MTALPRGETPDSPAPDDEDVVADVSAPSPTEEAPAEEAPAEEAAAEEAPAGADTAADSDTAAPVLSEAEAELAAQRELLERIEKRKAEKDGPIPAGTKLSGPAADLLAAVRAVESGEKPGAAFFDAPAPAAPRRT